MRRKKRKNIKQLKTKMIFSFFLFVILSAFITINDFGLLKLIQLKKNKYNLQHDIYILTEQQKKLNNDIKEIQTNPEFVEKIAREKFMMAKPGEKIFRVIEYKQLDK